MGYRAEIDGLRAIAIVPVILFHAGFEIFSGGFIGVDVFFVISGYLITSIIMAEMDEGRFSLVKFYERRARRILPALFLAILISIVLAYFILLPHQIKDLSQSIVSAALFLSNYFFYLETDYFNEFTNKAPLLHTWTLAVEEQFYITFPLLLMMFYRFGKGKLNLIILSLLFLSLSSAIITFKSNPSLAFYSTHTRAWELMVGCFLAVNRERFLIFSNQFNATRFNIVSYEILGLIALSGIIFSIFFFNNKTPHPSALTLIPVCSTALLLLIGDNTDFVKKILSCEALVFIGLLSYSLYIFHQPVISFLYHSPFSSHYPSDTLFSIVVILITFILSYFSYFYFEKPIRFSRKIGKRGILASSVFFILLLSYIGFLGHSNNGFQAYFASKFKNEGGVALIDVDKEKEIINSFSKDAYALNDSNFSPSSLVRILVIGDSMARDAYLSLSKYKKLENEDSIDVKILGVDDECMSEFSREISNSVENSVCLKGTKIKHVKDLLKSSTSILLTAKWQETSFSKGIELAKLLSANYDSKVFMVGSIMFQDLTSLSIDFAKRKVTADTSKSLMYRNIRFDRSVISDKLRLLVERNNQIGWIEKSDFFCNRSNLECTVFNDEGLPLIWDNAHLTFRAYEPYAKFLLNSISKSDRSSPGDLNRPISRRSVAF